MLTQKELLQKNNSVNCLYDISETPNLRKGYEELPRLHKLLNYVSLCKKQMNVTRRDVLSYHSVPSELQVQNRLQ
jgi:hypothetical protein